MRIAVALWLLTVLLAGAFLLGHKTGTPSRASAGKKAAMQAPPKAPPAATPRSVRIGGTDDGAACAGAAPDAHALAIDRLTPGAQASLCAQARDVAWLGIVYRDGGTLSDACGVSGPVSTQQAYAGACRAGWVPRQSVQPVAG
ncbi:MAG TPA: hypothetical protein VNS79_05120 [Sphingobium sp.]|nr:hypothetical protein [Sphingobium sp.]